MAINTGYTDPAVSAVELLLTRIGHGEGLERLPVFTDTRFELVVRRSTAVPRSTRLAVREGHFEEGQT
jgi:hypothetical protein